MILLFVVLPLVGCRNDSATQDAQQPKITEMTPAEANPGQSNIVGHIFGTNLGGVLSVSLGDGVTVEQISGISASDIYVFFSVAGRCGSRSR